MLTLTVHEPPNPPADRVDRAEALVFIKDGFAWSAALFGPLWLLAHRLWWPLLGYLVVSGALQAVQWTTAVDAGWLTYATIALNVLVGLEAGALRAWALERRGWQNLGTVTGKTPAECERRFFEAWLPTQPIIASRTGAGAGADGPRKWWRLKSPMPLRT